MLVVVAFRVVVDPRSNEDVVVGDVCALKYSEAFVAAKVAIFLRAVVCLLPGSSLALSFHLWGRIYDLFGADEAVESFAAAP